MKKVQLHLQVANSFLDSGWSCTEAQEEEEEEEEERRSAAAAGAAAGVAVAAFSSS